MSGRTGQPSHRRKGVGRPRRLAIGWVLAAVLFGLAGLTWLALALLLHPKPRTSAAAPGAGSASSAKVPPSDITRICGNKAILGGGPSSSPPGAIVVPAGDNSSVNWSQANATYWFAPGTHTLAPENFAQIIPASGSTFIGAPGAILSGRHVNFYAFGGSAPRVTISYLTVKDFGTKGGNRDEGVVNHDSADGWKIDHSTLKDNAGAGTMLGSNNILSYNCLKDNQQYGFNAYSSAGPVNLVLDHNEITGNNTYNWESRVSGCGCTGGGKFWDVNGAVIKGNWVHGNHSVGLWADTNNRGFDIEHNYIAGNYGSGLIYEISYNALIKNNTFVRNGLGAGPKNRGFPTGAIYLSESGSDSRIPGKYGRTFSVTGNTFINNWGGVVLWENADRFCGSPANTSSGTCTLVRPTVVKVGSCDARNIADQPYFGGCRWKTQNVLIDHNVFDFDPRDVGPSCTVRTQCGFQGLFSQYGSYPSWSPYKGTVVENHITFEQNNHFMSNTYTGPWRFMVRAQGHTVNWTTWQGRPYNQDAGSTMNPR
jgi:parallel beta helix pectate lyase-like protein